MMTSKAFELSQLSFGDNVKAEFGASSDLQIYHNGSDSYVDDTGSGGLILRGNAAVTIGKYTGETMGYFEADGSAYLYHNNSIKFQTTSVGVGVDQLFGISDTDTGIALGANGANIMQFYTGNNERLRIDENGQVGIGATSLTRELTVKKNDQCDVSIVAATNQSAQLLFGDTDADNRGIIEYNNSSDYMAFTTAGSERMKLDSSGNIFMGSFNASGGSVGVKFDIGGGTSEAEIQTSVSGTATRTHYKFINNNGAVGTITTNGSATTYATSSDYRLKENVTDVTDGITRLKQLAPKRFNFIADADKTVDGFIAHEVSNVVPEAITGTKDEVDADGNPKWQGIDQSKLVPLLTAALQEAITEIETLKTKVAALESE